MWDPGFAGRSWVRIQLTARCTAGDSVNIRQKYLYKDTGDTVYDISPFNNSYVLFACLFICVRERKHWPPASPLKATPSEIISSISKWKLFLRSICGVMFEGCFIIVLFARFIDIYNFHWPPQRRPHHTWCCAAICWYQMGLLVVYWASSVLIRKLLLRLVR